MTVAYAALWFFAFSVPWENVVVIPGLGTISRLGGMVAIGFCLLSVAVSGRLRRWDGMHVAMLFFLFWAGAGQLFFHAGDALSKKFWTYIQLGLAVWMIWELAASRRRQVNLMLAYVLGAYVAVAGTLWTYHRGAGVMRRFAAQGFDPNDLAMTLALAFPMAWYVGSAHWRPIVRWAGRAYLPLGLVGVALTGSRGGMVASAMGLMIVPFMMRGLSPTRLATLMLLVSVSGGLAVVYVPKTVVARLASTGGELEGGGLGGRLKLWVAGTQAFIQRPLIGYGSGAFKAAITPMLGTFAQVAHNSYLSVLVEQGLIGFVFFMGMFVAVFRALRGLSASDRRFALVLFATLGVAMLPLSWDDSKPMWVVLALLLGFARSQVGMPQPAPGLPSVPVTPSVRAAQVGVGARGRALGIARRRGTP